MSKQSSGSDKVLDRILSGGLGGWGTRVMLDLPGGRTEVAIIAPTKSALATVTRTQLAMQNTNPNMFQKCAIHPA